MITVRKRHRIAEGRALENEWGPRFSPDGRWLAYSDDDSGRFEIYVRPFPGPCARSQVSTEGGLSRARQFRRLLVYKESVPPLRLPIRKSRKFRLRFRRRHHLPLRVFHRSPFGE